MERVGKSPTVAYTRHHSLGRASRPEQPILPSLRVGGPDLSGKEKSLTYSRLATATHCTGSIQV